MSENTVEINPSGDRELWLVSGDDWCIPVYADPYESAGEPRHRLYLVSPALGLMKQQFEQLLATIKIHSLSEAHATAWWFNQDSFRAIAQKAPGITPKYYYKWNGKLVEPNPTVPQQAEIVGDITDDAEAFIKFIYSSTSYFTMTQLRLFWRAFYQYGLEWLLNKHRAIDLGFCKLHPMPYRQNWKEIMLAKYPRHAHIFRMPIAEIKRLLDVSEFRADLFHTDLTALELKNHFFYWTIEAVPMRPWTVAVERAELVRRRTKGPTAYANYYLRQIKARYPAILDAYKSFIKEVSRPAARVVEGSADGAPALIPNMDTARARPKAGDDGTAPIVVSTEEKLRGPTPGQQVAKAIQDVWKMPNLLLEDANVRESRKRVDKPADGGAGTGGVPMHDDGKDPVL